MYKKQIIILVICLLSACLYVRAQAIQKGTTYLKVIPVDTASFVLANIQLIDSFPSADSCLHFVQLLPSRLSAKGFVAVSVDSLYALDSSHFVAHVFLGKKYRWHSFSMLPQDKALLAQLGVVVHDVAGKPLAGDFFEKTANSLLQYYLNHGYPFAKIKLDSVQFDAGLVSAALKIDKGFLYEIDSINIIGDAQISQNFLHHYLGFEKHEPYSQKKLQLVDAQMRNLPYVKVRQPSTVTMRNTGAMLNLYLDKKPTNELDAIIGFMPANREQGGKLLLTGLVSLNLKNAFGGGESVGVHWQQLRPKSPKINIAFQRPYLFQSPFGIDLSFGLYKQDSAYVNAYGNVGALYQFSAKQTGKVFLNLASSRSLTIDTLRIIQTRQLPQVMDVSSINIGFGYAFDNTDYRPNPRRGTTLSATILTGNKQIKKNNTITQLQASDSFDFARLYDTVQLKSYQIRLQIAAAHYFSIGEYSVLKTAANVGVYQSPTMFANELFLIGGYRLLRGFDEESIFANAYTVGSVEYRYLIGRNSFFFGFSDFGWSQYKQRAYKAHDAYLSFGLGMAFETKAGIFNFSVASGKDKNTHFGLSNAKVHIGYTTLF